MFRYISNLLFFSFICFSSLGQNLSSESSPYSANSNVPIEFNENQFPLSFFSNLDKIKNQKPSSEISDQIVRFMNASIKGSEMYIAIYLFNYKPIIDAVIKAYNRGVDIHLIVDSSQRSNNSPTIEKLYSQCQNMEIIEVRNDAGKIAINHNKFILLSEVATVSDTLKNVVFQTSQNFHESSLNKIQEAAVFMGDFIYSGYKNYWSEIKAHAKVGMKNFNFISTEKEGIQLNFYPKRKDGIPLLPDSMIELLNSIENPCDVTVKIAMSDWSDSRVNILNKLIYLKEQGAQVEIITKSGKGPLILEGLNKLYKLKAYIKVYDLYGNISPKINLHTKLMIIETESSNSKGILVTGTQNFTNNALWNNNETTLIIKENSKLFDSYNLFFEDLKTLPGLPDYN